MLCILNLGFVYLLKYLQRALEKWSLKDKPKSFGMALSDRFVRENLGRCVGAEQCFPAPWMELKMKGEHTAHISKLHQELCWERAFFPTELTLLFASVWETIKSEQQICHISHAGHEIYHLTSFHSLPEYTACSWGVLCCDSPLGSHVHVASALLGLWILHQTWKYSPRWENGGRVPCRVPCIHLSLQKVQTSNASALKWFLIETSCCLPWKWRTLSHFQ